MLSREPHASATRAAGCVASADKFDTSGFQCGAQFVERFDSGHVVLAFAFEVPDARHCDLRLCGEIILRPPEKGARRAALLGADGITHRHNRIPLRTPSVRRIFHTPYEKYGDAVAK